MSGYLHDSTITRGPTYKYIHPDKLYVIKDSKGVPNMVVQRRDIAEVMAKQVGGSYSLVPFYTTEKFEKDFGVKVFHTPKVVPTVKWGDLHAWNKTYKF